MGVSVYVCIHTHTQRHISRDESDFISRAAEVTHLLTINEGFVKRIYINFYKFEPVEATVPCGPPLGSVLIVTALLLRMIYYVLFHLISYFRHVISRHTMIIINLLWVSGACVENNSHFNYQLCSPSKSF